MCQAIVKPEGILIQKNVLRQVWQDNSDGAGYAYLNPQDKKVYYAKGFFSFKSFWQAYRRHQKYAVLLHFRFATFGARNEENCHPFVIGDNAVVAHNGHMSQFATDPKRSDSRTFCEDFLTPAITKSKLGPSDFVASPVTQSLLPGYIGSANKLAFLTEKGFTIVNEKAGEWCNGVWYSAGNPMVSYRTMLREYLTGNTICDDLSLTNYSVPEWEQEILATDKVQESDNQIAKDRKIRVCELCNIANTKLYDFGTDRVCGPCWDDLTIPGHRPSESYSG